MNPLQLFRSSRLKTRSGALPSARAMFDYDHPRVRKKNYLKTMHKERAKEKKRMRMQNPLDPKLTRSGVPSFFSSARVKLFWRMVADRKNSTFPDRKPIPPDVKAEFVAKSKEYHAYKERERQMIYEEMTKAHEIHMEASKAALLLPDYLVEEVFADPQTARDDDLKQFMPWDLYGEQIVRVFPRELGCRFKMLPAFEEHMNAKMESAMGKRLRIKNDTSAGSGALEDI